MFEQIFYSIGSGGKCEIKAYGDDLNIENS